MVSPYYENHKEEYKQRAKNWAKNNPEAFKAIQKRYRQNHKKERVDKNRDYRRKNPEKVKAFPSNSSERQRKYRMKLKLMIYELLGGKCANPYNIDHTAFEKEPDYISCLQIDHINGGGKREIGTLRFYNSYLRYVLEKIKKGSKDYQLLCANCNWIKRKRGLLCL